MNTLVRRHGIPFNQYEHIRTWKCEGFRLELFDTHTLQGGGPQQRLAYQFFDSAWHREVGVEPTETRIFVGDDFGCSPMNSIDGDACVAGLLSFLSLQPGDTDEDYFDDYTEEQKTWCSARAEYLSLLGLDLEEAARAHCILCGAEGCSMTREVDARRSLGDNRYRLWICEECVKDVASRVDSEEWYAAPGYQKEEETPA